MSKKDRFAGVVVEYRRLSPRPKKKEPVPQPPAPKRKAKKRKGPLVCKRKSRAKPLKANPMRLGPYFEYAATSIDAEPRGALTWETFK